MDGGLDEEAWRTAGGSVCMVARDRAAVRCSVGTLHAGSLHFLHMHAFELVPSDRAPAPLRPPEVGDSPVMRRIVSAAPPRRLRRASAADASGYWPGALTSLGVP